MGDTQQINSSLPFSLVFGERIGKEQPMMFTSNVNCQMGRRENEDARMADCHTQSLHHCLCTSIHHWHRMLTEEVRRTDSGSTMQCNAEHCGNYTAERCFIYLQYRRSTQQTFSILFWPEALSKHDGI